MRAQLRRGVRFSLTGAVALAATAVVVTTAPAPVANAAPCGGTGAGSSGNSSSGSGSAPTDPGTGGQGPLPTWSNSTSKPISWVTGPQSPNSTLSRFSISGTDLGIAWDNGSGQTLMAYGDTFGWCNIQGQQWRHNVLMRTEDNNLADGITIANAVPGDNRSGAVVSADAPTLARDMIGSFGVAGVEITTIPTTGIAIDGKQYVNYMSVRQWGTAGNWDTNFSGIAVSADNGQTWQSDLNTLRINAGITLPTPVGLPDARANDGKFQQNAYVKGHGDEADWIYQFGTPNGRFGGAFLARFHPANILNVNSYEYWTGTAWTTDMNAMPDYPASAVVKAPVSEISVAWSEHLHKYVMLNGDNGISMLVADKPQGPWTLKKTLIPAGALIVYAPMMMPNSPALLGTGDKLYFNASRWSDYNVMLIESDVD